jgi:penicillin amidase
VSGLSAPVRVVRDRFGIAHIEAANRDDLFVAQGFVQAQDRLFQMDLWRRSVQGRLSEVLGANFADRDAMTRRIQYRGDIEVEWASYAPDTRPIVEAFVRGINAWVALARERPPEEFVLAGWLPEPWAANDLLNRTDAFAAAGDAIEEIFRARIVAVLGARRAANGLPPDPPIDIPRGLDPSLISPVVGDLIRSVGAPPFFLGLAVAPPPADPSEAAARRGDIPLDVRSLPLPSPHYLVHLRAPGWNVIGATSPWLPGVAVGHNERVGWSADPVDVDVQDVFVERLNPSNPHQIEERGRWIDTQLAKDPLIIRGRDKPLAVERERTRRGVFVAVDGEQHLAFAIGWTGTEPGAAGDLVALELDRASDSENFRDLLVRWKLPARRFTYADVNGRTGSRIAALAPVRRGWSGALPVPGWTGAYEWAGWRQPEAVAPSSLGRVARRDPARAAALIRALQETSKQADGLAAARALIVNAVADSMRDEGAARSPVLFVHPLAISEATRRRFNVGPLRPDLPDTQLFLISSNPADWDRSTATNPPGQGGAPSSKHYADLAQMWRQGTPVPLAFSDGAISGAAESTLTLAPGRGSAAR